MAKTLVRHRNERETVIPKIVIKQSDPEVQEKFDAMISRRRELAERLASVNCDQEQIKIKLGGFVAAGCDWREYTDRLAELKAEAGAIRSGIDYLDGQIGLLKRSHYWLTTR